MVVLRLALVWWQKAHHHEELPALKLQKSLGRAIEGRPVMGYNLFIKKFLAKIPGTSQIE